MSSKRNRKPVEQVLTAVEVQRRAILIGAVCLATVGFAHLSVSISAPLNGILFKCEEGGTCSVGGGGTELGSLAPGKRSGAGGAGSGGADRLGGEQGIIVPGPSVSSGGVDLEARKFMGSSGDPTDPINATKMKKLSGGGSELYVDCHIVPFSGSSYDPPDNSTLEVDWNSTENEFTVTDTNSGTTWVFGDDDGASQFFLTSKTDGNGTGWTINRDSDHLATTATSSGFTVHFDYDTSDRITAVKVRKPSSSVDLRRTDYSYDSHRI